MNTVTSKDGTKIAYDKQGKGPAVLFVYGALCDRSSGSLPELVKLLAPHFTVYNYDRRGRGDAVALFMQLTGMPADQIEAMRHAPIWPMLEAIAPTLAYDHTAILGEDASVPTGRAALVTAPTLVMNGGASYAFMYDTAQALGKAIPNAQVCTLEGQTHDVDLDVLAS